MLNSYQEKNGVTLICYHKKPLEFLFSIKSFSWPNRLGPSGVWVCLWGTHRHQHGLCQGNLGALSPCSDACRWDLPHCPPLPQRLRPCAGYHHCLAANTCGCATPPLPSCLTAMQDHTHLALKRDTKQCGGGTHGWGSRDPSQPLLLCHTLVPSSLCSWCLRFLWENCPFRFYQ